MEWIFDEDGWRPLSEGEIESEYIVDRVKIRAPMGNPDLFDVMLAKKSYPDLTVDEILDFVTPWVRINFQLGYLNSAGQVVWPIRGEQKFIHPRTKEVIHSPGIFVEFTERKDKVQLLIHEFLTLNANAKVKSRQEFHKTIEQVRS